MVKRAWIAVLIAVLLLVLAQFVPVTRDNPPVESEVPTSPDVARVLNKSCYDCHSNETVWPWYSHVAPVSWLVTHDVHEGRDNLNFTTWNRYNPRQQIRKLKEIKEQVERGKMPPGNYVSRHPAARLTKQDREIILNWTGNLATQVANQPGADSTAAPPASERGDGDEDHGD